MMYFKRRNTMWFCAAVAFMVAVLPLASYSQIHQEEPEWVYKGRGDRYLKAGEPGKAIVEYKKALISDSGSKRAYPEVNMKLAEIYLEEKLYDLALSYIESAQEEEQYLQIPDMIYDIRSIKAEIYARQGKYLDVVSVYENIIQEDSNWRKYAGQDIYVIEGTFFNDPESKKKYANAYFELGKIKFDFQNYDNAIPFFKIALMYNFKKEESLRYLINCYKKLNNPMLAKKAQSLYTEK
jgi:tetratricopeptide (TPR) repeat protein